MRKNKFYILGMPALLLAFDAVVTLTFGGCPNAAIPGTETRVTELSLDSLVTEPVKGATPVPRR
jgi:hypothetical protein